MGSDLINKDIMPSLFRRLSALWKKEPIPSSAPEPIREIPVPVEALSPSTATAPDPSLPLSEELVYQALRNCRDPEIPVNIVDLGLIYDVRVADAQVNVKMTLTTQGCGMGGHIAREAEEQIQALPGVRAAKVELVWDPPWNPSMISLTGRKTLGLPE